MASQSELRSPETGTESGGEAEYRMLPVPEALTLVLAQSHALPVVELPLAQVLGMVLGSDVLAPDPLPPFPASMKDGYAVVAGDGPGEYPLVGEVRAGGVADFTLEPGQVAYITTGAPLPPGADAVVMVEETSQFGRDGAPWVRIGATVDKGADVRAVGVDVAEGQVVLGRGTRLGPAELGILATVGQAVVPVHRRPVVGVLSTGDELVEPGAALGPGQIRDSNRAALLAAVAALGGEPLDLGIAGDEADALAAALQRGIAQADILLTSGGVSMGDLDLVKPLLARLGTVHFGRLLMKPGKPLTFATVATERAGVADQAAGGAADQGAEGAHRCLVFGLPGNPVSSMVTFLLLAVPAMRQLAGATNPHWPRVQAELAQPLRLDAYRPEFHRATLQWDVARNGGRGGFVATSTGIQASSRLLSMRTANGLLLLPVGEETLPAGAVVDALVIGEL
ncbi:MAG: gephyrin-like molybdotransferase Glp [Litorilinea sp.]